MTSESRTGSGGIVKTRIQSLSFLATLALFVGMMSWGGTLHAQNAPSTPPDQQQPQSQQPSDTQQQQQAPDQSQAPTDVQTFSGTVVKSGDKYVLKDTSGKVYDIDHQDQVKKFEGKRVRVQGTLDATGTKITVQ
jgi:hypothetical protein